MFVDDLFAETPSPLMKRAGKLAHHRPTEITRADVAARVAAGQSTGEIAMALGISPPTCRAHYRTELGPHRYRHVPEPEIRAKIAAAVTAGGSVAEIVVAVGISRKVLFRCYRAEISAALNRHGRE